MSTGQILIGAGLLWAGIAWLGWAILAAAARADRWHDATEEAMAIGNQPRESMHDHIARVLASDLDAEWAEMDGAK